MICNPERIKKFALMLGALLILSVSVHAQNGATVQQAGALSLLDSTRERDGLFGSVRRVKVQTARLETKQGRSVEGPLQLQEITTYSVSGDRIENVSYPVGTTAVGKEEYKYNERGQIVEMTLRGDDGTILSRERYDYEFDDFGNWIRMVTNLVVYEGGELKFEPVEVTYRSLAYYFNDSVAEMVGVSSRSTLSPPTTPQRTANLSSTTEKSANQLTLANQPASSTEVAIRKPLEAQPREPEKNLPATSETRESRSAVVNPVPASAASDTEYLSFSPKAFAKRKENEPEAPALGRSASLDGARAAESKSAAADRSTPKQKEKTPKASTELRSLPASAAAPPANNAAPRLSAEQLKSFDLYKAGRQHFDSGQIKEAIDAYQQSIKLEPKSAEVHLSLGHAYLRLKQDQQAIKSFRQATTLNPELAEGFYGLGLSYFNLRRHREAANAFKEATVVRPNLAKAHYGLALAYQELGDEEGVLTEFRVLETLDSTLAKKLADTFPEFNLPCRVPPYCK